MTAALAGLLALASPLALAQDAVPEVGSDGAASDAAADAAAEEAPEEPVPPDMRGTWRFDLRIVSNAKVPVLGTTEVKSRTTFLATVSGSQERPTIHTVPCHLQAEPSRAIAKTIVPKTFIDALPQKRFPAELKQQGEGWAFHADMKPQYLGYDPKIAGEKPPHDKDAKGITDLEGDGHPGGTIHLDAPIFGIIELYVVQRAHTVLDGSWTGAEVWEGDATVLAFGQRTIGASNRLFVANAEVTVDQKNSRYRWARVPEGTSCSQLKKGTGAPSGGKF